MNSAAGSNHNQQAELALSELDTEKAEQLFLDLILALEDAFNKNQKDVAAELQRIAKSIESIGKVEDSIRFKQRTCEIMLRRSMAERRRNQVAPQPKETKSLTQLVFVCFTADPASYSSFLQRSELCTEVRVLPDGARFMRSINSQLVLIARQSRLSGFFPLFLASSREEATRHMQETGNFLEGDEIDVCGMKLLVLKDKAGQKFLLAGADILQNV